SFGNVTAHMARAGVEHPELVPLATDIAIPVFGLAYLVLVRMDMELAWVRWFPYILTGVTIYLNVTSTTNTTAQVAHAALPTLWVAFTEIVAHVYRVRLNVTSGRRHDPIPVSRWIYEPLATLHLQRHMRLWNVRSYDRGLQLRAQRLRTIAALRRHYNGRRWRFHAPLTSRSNCGWVNSPRKP
ncbi:DUF2637 domain-containing protein, partial [Streptomyces sp. Ac-502]|uniref:DUF2637 domain-containing protein n=1 Tax=Streptomyces sp. Ac-502 TaxID=3342801 RepID=UPI00386297AF